MPTVFASVSVTILLFYVVTLVMAYGHILPVGSHMLWGFFMTILIVLLQCLTFGFFIGSGKSIKRAVQESGLSPDWIQKTKDYKNQCYPALMLAILASAVAGILGGGVAVKAIPAVVHEIFVWTALGLNVRSLWISYRVIVENVNAIHRINEEVRKRDPGPLEHPALPTPGKLETAPLRAPSNQASKFYFLAAAFWVPYLYMRWSLGSRTFPYWPFIVISVLCLLAGWLASGKSDKA